MLLDGFDVDDERSGFVGKSKAGLADSHLDVGRRRAIRAVSRSDDVAATDQGTATTLGREARAKQ